MRVPVASDFAVIGIDWGTTSFRAYRLGPQGRIVESRTAEKGILSVQGGQFARVLEEHIAGWDDGLLVMSGMVGSRQGWVEAPYVNCPAGPDQIASSMKSIQMGNRTGWIVPGLSCVDPSGVPDVIRGEETQLIGVLDDLPGDATVCLPGTHSKWATVRDGRIVSFATCFTGELFSVLSKHSLLGRMMEEGAPDEAAFAEGIERSGEAGGLLHHLFGVRTRGLFGELSGSQSPSYLSGILIGHELRSFGLSKKVFFLGTEDLVDRYARAATFLGLQAKALDPQAAARGLYRLGLTRS